MFRPDPAAQYVASKSQSVKPDVVSDIQPLDQIRLLIPSFVDFLNPKETYLRAELQMVNARGVIVPDKKGGIHSLFRNVIIRDGGNTATLENLEDYNSQCCMTSPFTAQSSLKHKRELFEGVQDDANNSGESLYYAAPQSLAGATDSATAIGTPRVAKKIEIYTQLKAGIFANGTIPNALMGGMRIQIDTEDPNRALTLPFIGGSLEAGLGATSERLSGDIIAGAVGTRDGADAANNTGTITTNITSSVAGENNPFAIDDILYIQKKNGGAYDGTTEEVLGVISGFFITGGKLGIRLTLQANNGVQVPSVAYATGGGDESKIYYKVSDREKALSVLSATTLLNTKDRTIPAPSYTISGLEMLCSVVSPPASYVEGMLKKSLTAEGVSMDYMTSELHRFNQVNTQGLVQVQIPTLATRGKAVFCQPIPQSHFRSLSTSSFSGRADGARNYQFVKGTELIPSRVADLERYSQTVGTSGQKRNEPLHTSELQKALINIEEPVFSLQKIAESFVIARAFNKYSQITDLASQTLSLRVDYDAGAVQKIFNNFVYKLARLTISNGQVSVVS